MLRTRSPVLSFLAAFAVVIAACGTDDSPDASDTTVAETVAEQTSSTTVESTTEVDSPSDEEPPSTEATPTTEATAEPVGADSPADAATALYDAWVNDDRDAASEVADPDAIETMWTAEKGPYELYRHCDDGEFDTSGCLFRDRSTDHTIQINLERRDGGWVVSGTFYSED